MKQIKAILVESDLLQRKELKRIITKHSHIKVAKECIDGVEVLKFLQNNNVDLIFLNINTKKLDGILLANIINKFEDKPKIVFTTKHEEYAAKAYSLDIYDYILKPYSEERLIRLFKKLDSDCLNKQYVKSKFIDNTSNKLSLWKNEKIVVVDTHDIYFCEAHKKISYIHTKDEKFEIKEGISHVEDIINDNNFYRCHRSYLVNITKIEEIIPWINNTYIIRLKNKQELEVSRSKVKGFRQLMHL